MQKKLLFIILSSILFSQIEHPHPPLNLVSIPTGGTLPRGSYTMEMLLQKNGGFLPQLAVGITDHFTIGMSYGLQKLIGDEKPEVSRPKPEVQIKYQVYEETLKRPAILLGLNTQGRGEYRGKVLDNGIKKILNRYDQKAWGIFLVISKNYNLLGNLGFHGGLSKNSWENDYDNDGQTNLFFGLDKEINRSFSFLLEYDAAYNDDNSSDDINLNELTFGKGKGYLNAGFRWAIAKNLLFEFNFNNISKNTDAEYTNREIKIMYSEFF